MRKGFLLTMAAILACFVLMGAACADYGYTNVSQIPMAADFSFRVDSYQDGYLKIVTDYPFKTTGASEINLIYWTPDGDEAFTLNYKYPGGTTRVGSYHPNHLRNGSMQEAYKLVQSGKAVWDGNIHINTSHFSTATDWFLVYSTNGPDGNQYTSYTERTNAQSFDGLAPGGISKSIIYENGRIVESQLLNRTVDADLVIYYNQYGEIKDGYVIQYTPEFRDYYYNPSSGLFSGHKITELGYTEADLQTEPLAAIGERTAVLTDTTDAADTIVVTTMNDVITMDGLDTTNDIITSDGLDTTTVAEEPVVPAVQADRSNFRFASSLIGGLLIGLTLYYTIRRRIAIRKQEKAEQAEAAKRSAQALNDAVSSLENSPSNPEEYVEPSIQQVRSNS